MLILHYNSLKKNLKNLHVSQKVAFHNKCMLNESKKTLKVINNLFFLNKFYQLFYDENLTTSIFVTSDLLAKNFPRYEIA